MIAGEIPEDTALALYLRMQQACYGHGSGDVIEAVASMLCHVSRVIALPGYEEALFDELVRTAREALRKRLNDPDDNLKRRKGMN